MNLLIATAFVGSALLSCGSGTDNATTTPAHLKILGGGSVGHHHANSQPQPAENTRHSDENGSERLHSSWSSFGSWPEHGRLRGKARSE